MPQKKRVKKSRVKKPVKKGLKQKQKQKQEQKVNVSVSAGGSGGGGTQFIPMPSAPAFDYAQLANLIRPANTVDVPIRAQANPEPIVARAAETQTLAAEFPRPSREAPPIPVMGMGSSTMFQEEKAPSADMPIAKGGGKVKGRPVGSKNKPKPVAYVVQGGYESDMPSGGEYERMREAQKSGSFM